MKLGIVAIGIPGAGKTTVLMPIAERYGVQRISRDEIREELFGDPLDRSSQEKVWKEADRRMRDALAAGFDVMLDSTFVSREKRGGIISDLRDAGADRVIGVIFDTPIEVAKERNRARAAAVGGHVVEDSVIETAYAQLVAEPPALSDGFDALYTTEQLDELESRELSR